MTRCPKCGCSQIMGPKYCGIDPHRGGRESLIYTCFQCGYRASEPTLQQLDTERAQDGSRP